MREDIVTASLTHEQAQQLITALEDQVADLTARLATVEQERDELRDELEAEKRQTVWSIEEHRRACEAIQSAEGLPVNTYPSFQERVWWRAAQCRIAELEALLAQRQPSGETSHPQHTEPFPGATQEP